MKCVCKYEHQLKWPERKTDRTSSSTVVDPHHKMSHLLAFTHCSCKIWQEISLDQTKEFFWTNHTRSKNKNDLDDALVSGDSLSIRRGFQSIDIYQTPVSLLSSVIMNFNQISRGKNQFSRSQFIWFQLIWFKISR